MLAAERTAKSANSQVLLAETQGLWTAKKESSFQLVNAFRRKEKWSNKLLIRICGANSIGRWALIRFGEFTNRSIDSGDLIRSICWSFGSQANWILRRDSRPFALRPVNRLLRKVLQRLRELFDLWPYVYLCSFALFAGLLTKLIIVTNCVFVHLVIWRVHHCLAQQVQLAHPGIRLQTHPVFSLPWISTEVFWPIWGRSFRSNSNNWTCLWNDWLALSSCLI